MGHFLAARYFGVRVESFSIGFGKSLVGFTDSYGTRWKIGWLPLGGYVKFWGDEGVSSTPDKDTLERISAAERAGSFHHKPLFQKSIIAAAGPIANFVLAIVILSSLFLIYGTEVSVPRVGGVKAGSPAEAGGLKAGDLVVAINDRKIVEFDEIVRVVTVSDGRPLNFVVERGKETVSLTVTPRMIAKPDLFGEQILDPGIGIHPVYPGLIDRVVEGSPAAKAGLAVEDIILGVNGKPLNTLRDFSSAVLDANGKSITLIVSRLKRDPKKPWLRETKTMTLVPLVPTSTDPDRVVLESAGFEVAVKGAPESDIRVTLGPVAAVERAAGVIQFIVVKTFYFIGQLLTGTGDYRQLSGPVGIASVSGQVLVQFGVVPLINLAAVLSVSIGLLNLFPIPMLDGGHLLYYALEAVRGRPLGERAQELGFRIGLAFVVCLFLFATWNDISKQFLS
jgi:regulator of sigma E protease